MHAFIGAVARKNISASPLSRPTMHSRFRYILKPLIALGMSTASASVAAHFPWWALDTMATGLDTTVAAPAAFGHGPGEGARALDATRLREVLVLRADGQSVDVPVPEAGPIMLPPLEVAGPVVLAARQQRGYWSRGAEGGKPLSREQMPEATSCAYSNNGIKAVLMVRGETAHDASEAQVLTRPVGHPLELLLMRPDGWQAGATIAPRLLHRGQPLAGSTITLSSLDRTQDDADTQQAVTDVNGVAAFTLPGTGRWLLHAHVTEPFDDAEVCDEHSLYATLVFQSH